MPGFSFMCKLDEDSSLSLACVVICTLYERSAFHIPLKVQTIEVYSMIQVFAVGSCGILILDSGRRVWTRQLLMVKLLASTIKDQT